MSDHRTRPDDSIGDIGLGSVLMLVALMIGVPPLSALLYECFHFRPNAVDPGYAFLSAGAMLLALFAARFLARGLVGLFRR